MRQPDFLIRALAAVLLLFAGGAALSSSNSYAQETTGSSQEAGESAGTLKVNVDVVNVYCNVKDKKGALLPGLKKDDFELFENGARQNIKYFSAESNQPLTLGILMDTSGSMIQVIPAEKQVGAAFLEQVLSPKDMAFLITFDVNVDLLQDFTSSARDMRDGLARARINTGGGGFSGGIPGIGGGPLPSGRSRGTALYDGIFLASEEKLSREVGRKAMIIMTDGVDEGSKVPLREAVEAAQKADAICYVLLFSHGIYGDRGQGDMRKLTEETGGRVFSIDKTEHLKTAFDQIASELRTQYAIGYTPTNGNKDGSFRKIEIRSKEGYRVQARRGYYAVQQ